MSVVSFKVKRKVKEKMLKYKDKINWSEELRRFVEEKIRELEAQENMEKIIKELEEIPLNIPRGFAASSVREDRDSG